MVMQKSTVCDRLVMSAMGAACHRLPWAGEREDVLGGGLFCAGMMSLWKLWTLLASCLARQIPVYLGFRICRLWVALPPSARVGVYEVPVLLLNIFLDWIFQQIARSTAELKYVHECAQRSTHIY